MEGKRWTPEEDEFLKKHYDTSSYKEIALALERTPVSIKARSLKLGLKKKNERHYHRR